MKDKTQNSMARDAFSAISEESVHAAIADEVLRNEKENPLKWEIRDELIQIAKIERAIKSILASNEPAYKWKVHNYTRKRQLVALDLSRYFHLFRTYSHELVDWQYPERHISLYAEVLAGMLESYWMGLTNPERRFSDTKFEADHFNEFLARLRYRCRSTEFRKALKKRGNVVRKMYYDMTSYIRHLNDRHHSLTALRLDLYFPEALKTSAEEAKAYMSRFLKNRERNHAFDDCVGYIWKLEYGWRSAYHYHCFFFLNGQDPEKVDGIQAQRLGEYWKGLFAVEGAWYNNCDLEMMEYDEAERYATVRPQYCNKGIGALFSCDEKKWRDLYDAVAYLAKREQAVPLRQKGFRIWGHG